MLFDIFIILNPIFLIYKFNFAILLFINFNSVFYFLKN